MNENQKHCSTQEKSINAFRSPTIVRALGKEVLSFNLCLGLYPQLMIRRVTSMYRFTKPIIAKRHQLDLLLCNCITLEDITPLLQLHLL